MKRTALLKKINKAAKAVGLSVEITELTRHSGIRVGNTATTIPRHNEIHERMAEVICKQLEGELGKGWWR